MTNGCFDILHAGHVAYLAEARRLAIAFRVVNDDARGAIERRRPAVNPLEQRMAVLAALAPWTGWFLHRGYPERLICATDPMSW